MAKALELPIIPGLDPLVLLKLVSDGEGCSVLGDINCGYDGCNCSEAFARIGLYFMGFADRGDLPLDSRGLRKMEEIFKGYAQLPKPAPFIRETK